MFRFTKFKITARHAASSVAVAASLFFTLSQFENDRVRQEHDLDLSSVLLADGLREAVEPLLHSRDMARLMTLCEQFGRRGRLAGIAVYTEDGALIAGTRSLGPLLRGTPTAVAQCLSRRAETHDYEDVGGQRLRVESMPLHKIHGASGAVAVFHDTWFIEAREDRSRVVSAQRLAFQAALFLAAVWIFELFFNSA